MNISVKKKQMQQYKIGAQKINNIITVTDNDTEGVRNVK
jgi:DNA topoisomerase IA